MDTCRKRLQAGLDELNLTLGDEQIDRLLSFIGLIDKWNKAFNLTSIRDQEAMVSLHLLDSLAVLPYVTGQKVIDIGTGAGLPGIPLAVCRPDKTFTLLDSNSKKTRFVQQAVLELKLTNVQVCHGRVEDFASEHLFDTVITRAFTNLPDMLKMTGHLIAPGGVLLAMKGQYPEQELQQIGDGATVIPIRVPGIEAQRCLIKINKPTQRE
ncbi:16S rRNA (guanine(527)-N(7))-methyltransferase RsmG [Methylotuvimicrobium sp. KM1]|uniref:16S rRNA (guanine(527)-N(7))-methyltransferase RsmG n=1 Tax=Methylotuvimicrobium sp. KM1 TaxID=3377707 RepID=UPI00384C789E